MKSQVNASVRMSSALHARVMHLAETRQRTPHALMLQAIESYITREEQRESLRLQGIAAWENYERTGLHVTGEEVREWIEQIRQDKKTPFPKCHV